MGGSVPTGMEALGAQRDGAGAAAAEERAPAPQGAYVPPSMRGGAAGATGGAPREIAYEERLQLRVSNLSPDTSEDDLRNLFQPFGRVEKVYIAKDHATGESRGFAYIKFQYHTSAEEARKNLHGYPLHHMVMRVDWSEPREDRGGPGGSSQAPHRNLSGYGKALADTRGSNLL